jgi:hypothetical protein
VLLIHSGKHAVELFKVEYLKRLDFYAKRLGHNLQPPQSPVVLTMQDSKTDRLGHDLLKSSNRFSLNSTVKLLIPVMFPPGRARLETRPVSTRFVPATTTMGIVVVSCLAARVAGFPWVTIMSTLSLTISAARMGSRSGSPLAYRHSIMMFCFSTYPSSRKRWRNASIAGLETLSGN